jgi:sialidase-1
LRKAKVMLGGRRVKSARSLNRRFLGISFVALIGGLTPARAVAQHQTICSGEAARGYAAFPDVCRLPNGELFCVFYSGYGHISKPNGKWPKGGRIMEVRSSDGGRHWSQPTVAIDTELDDRDPSVACLNDGTLLLNWFTPLAANADRPLAIRLARSADHGKTWSDPVTLEFNSRYAFACSSPVRQLDDGSLILGLYHEDEQRGLAFGATVKSYDGGKTWKDLALIGEHAGVYLDAETDVVQLGGRKTKASVGD